MGLSGKCHTRDARDLTRRGWGWGWRSDGAWVSSTNSRSIFSSLCVWEVVHGSMWEVCVVSVGEVCVVSVWEVCT